PRTSLLDEWGRRRLIDFGMARWRHAWSEGPAGPSGGTLAFMAPEQARCESGRVGAPSDIFALGAVLYFLLTGRAPFEGSTRDDQWRRAIRCDFDPAPLRARGVPHRLERIVLKAMAAEPGDRSASAADLADALDAFLRRPRRLALQAGALLLVAMAVGIWSLRSRPGLESGSTPQTPHSNAHPGPTSTKTASEAPRIESFQVKLYPRALGDPAGLIGINTFAGRF